MKCAIRQHLPYQKYIDLQKRLRKHRKEILLFCDHPAAITAGIKTSDTSLLVPEKQLQNLGIEFIRIRRAGDLTAHEPGQIVIYPHTDLRKREISFSAFFHSLIEITQKSIESAFSIKLHYDKERPGLYTGTGHKVVSIGLDLGKSFSTYGIAVNAWNALKVFECINPCGFEDLKAGSLANLGASPGLTSQFVSHWKESFYNYLNTLTVKKSSRSGKN